MAFVVSSFSLITTAMRVSSCDENKLVASRKKNTHKNKSSPEQSEYAVFPQQDAEVSVGWHSEYRGWHAPGTKAQRDDACQAAQRCSNVKRYTGTAVKPRNVLYV